jgi:hypothetical protein
MATWELVDLGDGEGLDPEMAGVNGHAITCPGLDGRDWGLRIYLREDDPLGHAAEIVGILNAHHAREGEVRHGG